METILTTILIVSFLIVLLTFWGKGLISVIKERNIGMIFYILGITIGAIGIIIWKVIE